MIPKVIHYCWFGRNPIPDEYRKYMESWRKFCPDYVIKEWNEDNFDVYENQYCKEAYEAGKWAFVSDYARLKIIYENGGIYLDTDVELVKPLEPLIENGIGYIGFQNEEEVNTGLGFAAAPKNKCVKEMLYLYNNRPFLVQDDIYDTTPCPVANTVALKRCGLITGKSKCKEIQSLDGINVYPIIYFNPISEDLSKCKIKDTTFTIHHYAATWNNSSQKHIRRIKKIIPNFILELRTNYISRLDIKKMEEKLRENTL